MENTVYVKSFENKPFNRSEILRYAGIKSEDGSMNVLISACIKEAEGAISGRVCYSKLPVRFYPDYIDLSFMKIYSNDLRKALCDADEAILFAATIGLGIDRLISKYAAVSPCKALIFQAIGAERIESLCDNFCEYAKCEFKNILPRFSPGYGDFSIEAQKDIFLALDCPRKIGLSLNSSLLMSPSKSVTAIMGISEKAKEKHSCKNCGKTDCEYRR